MNIDIQKLTKIHKEMHLEEIAKENTELYDFINQNLAYILSKCLTDSDKLQGYLLCGFRVFVDICIKIDKKVPLFEEETIYYLKFARLSNYFLNCNFMEIIRKNIY